MRSRRNDIDMLHGPLAGKLFLFALPLAASAVLQQLFNAADLAVVGNFATPQAMAAVGSNGSVISLLVSLFVGMSVGANVVIANLIGAGRREDINDAVHTVVALALASGAFLMAAGMLLAPRILRMMGAPEEVMSLAVVYLRIYFVGMPAIMLYNFGSAVLRSHGDSRRPFMSLTLAGIVNVLLNLLFVIVFRLHVIGVGLATVLSNYLAAGLTVAFLMNEQPEYRLRPAKIRFKREYLVSVLKIGVPAGIQGMVFSLSNVVIQTAVNSFGANCIAGNTAGQNFEFISYCIINAFGQTVVTFVSQNYGAGDAARCKKALREGALICLGIDIAVLAALYAGRYTAIRLFTTDPAIIEFAMVRIRYAMAFHFLCITYELPAGALRGLNWSVVPALISMLGTCAFRLVYVLVYLPTHRSMETLISVYPISWVLTGIVMITAYFIVSRKAFGELGVRSEERGVGEGD
ncbi:MAG: MATE family efflux transporter [Clostridiales bacterium]|nr:MATE family efflux transporter [Clostridiales bacterium]